VALVKACLQINNYFTVAKHPVIASFGKQGFFGVATNLDIIALRFPVFQKKYCPQFQTLW